MMILESKHVGAILMREQHSTGRTPTVKHSQQIHNTTCCHSTLLMQRIESVTVLNVTLAREV